MSNKIIVIDDHPLFRKGVAQLVAMDEQLVFAGEAARGEDAVELAKQTDADLVLLDLHMKGMSGIETLRALRAAGIDARIVMLTVSDNPDDVMAGIRAGADGYLLKDMEPEDLLAAIRDALFGRMAIDASVARQLARSVRDKAAAADRSVKLLTPREQAILPHVASGLSNKLIGRELGITEGTVKVHIKSLLRKLNFRSRVELAVWAVERQRDKGLAVVGPDQARR
ncbi:MAG TPA: two-component system response regulator NarL [Steroidobacter sp.]|nr:two-component system response regulator NarL [Steroidobacteraceae bacterium]HLS81644.1 two-component system response regulator NarL [Steroidobacter sp.]